MSDSKRATLITVGAPKSGKKNVSKTVRLTINLDESNESKYPELNYKELVIVEEKKNRQNLENGKTPGLDPFSDNDDDVERVARKFEQKYGSRSTYGRKGRSKHDEYADIGAGYDENDSFIDNTDGYDEMIPPECDTIYGGFYINSGSLEFKQVPEDQMVTSDSEMPNNRRNKRRISSSTSEDESSESSSESESQDEKDHKSNMVNGIVDSHQTEHRKKKNKKSKKGKRIRLESASAPTSGKQTSDDNNHGDGESADSRTSQSDSLTSKPAPSSENAITSDSSRDASDVKLENNFPTAIVQILEELSAFVTRLKSTSPNCIGKEIETATNPYILRLEKTMTDSVEARIQRSVWGRAARILCTGRNKLTQRVRTLMLETPSNTVIQNSNTVSNTTPAATVTQQPSSQVVNSKVTKKDGLCDNLDVTNMSLEDKEVMIAETLKRLKILIEEKTPFILLNYKAECDRVQEEKKKLLIASATEGGPHIEKRLPKRRFAWCHKSRLLLARLVQLADDEASAARLLAQRALPLFPRGFARIPTLLRQANLKGDLKCQVKPIELKRQDSTSAVTTPIMTVPSSQPYNDIHFPSSLTVTTTIKNTEKPQETSSKSTEDDVKKPKLYKSHSNSSASKHDSQYPVNTFKLNKDIIVECTTENKEDKHNRHSKENEKLPDKIVNDNEKYVPPNNIGSITITPVPNNHKSDIKQVKLTNNSVTITSELKQKEATIRVKSQATLMKEADELAKRDKHKSKPTEKTQAKTTDKKFDAPLHIDTTVAKDLKKSDSQKSSPNVSNKTDKADEVSKTQIENMRMAENNIPRPALIPVHHSPTFAKPDKRAPDPKKVPKKDIVIISDLDPLSDTSVEQLAIDDSSSDVEVIEEMATKSAETIKEINRISESNSSDVKKSDNRVVDSTVPSRSVIKSNSQNSHQSKHSSKEKPKPYDKINHTKDSIDIHKKVNHAIEKMDVDNSEADIHKLMQNIREMQDSQEHNFNSNSFGGVITSEQTSLNKTDGCSAAVG